MAAVLACGEGSVLAGRAAAHLLDIVRGRRPPPEVLTPTKRRLAGSRRSRVPRSERTRWRGIPVTTPARTLVDLAAVLGLEDLALACHDSGVRHHTTPRQSRPSSIAARTPGAPRSSGRSSRVTHR